MLIVKILLISFVGSLLSLDRILVQAMISRPIVLAPVIGLILGNPYAGLVIGAFLELFWIDRVPIGIYIPPNDSIACVFAASLAILAGQALGDVSKELIALSVLLAIPFGIMAKKFDVKMMQANNTLSDQALEDARSGNIRAIERKIWVGLGRMFLLYLLVLLVLQMVFIPSVIWLYPKLPSAFYTMLALIYYFLPLLGIAVALNSIKLRAAIPVFCAIFLILAAAMDIFHVF